MGAPSGCACAALPWPCAWWWDGSFRQVQVRQRCCQEWAAGVQKAGGRQVGSMANHGRSSQLSSAPDPSQPPHRNTKAHRRQAVHQLHVQGLEERRKQGGAGAQRRVVAAKHEAEEGLPLRKALQALAQQEGQEGKLELACKLKLMADLCRDSDRGSWPPAAQGAPAPRRSVAARPAARSAQGAAAWRQQPTQEGLLVSFVVLGQQLLQHLGLVQVERWSTHTGRHAVRQLGSAAWAAQEGCTRPAQSTHFPKHSSSRRQFWLG